MHARTVVMCVSQSLGVRVFAGEIEWTGIGYLRWLSPAVNFLSSSIPIFGCWNSVSSSAPGSFCEGEGPGRRVRQKQCLTASRALARLCAFLDV